MERLHLGVLPGSQAAPPGRPCVLEHVVHPRRGRQHDVRQHVPGLHLTGGIGSLEFPNCARAAPGNIAVGSRCRFDPSPFPGVESIPDAKTTTIFGSGKFQINPDWQAYAWGFYSKEEVRFVIQPVPISDQFFYGPTGDLQANVTLPPTSPFYPTSQAIAAGVNGQPLNVRYRAVLNGNRDTTDTNEGWQGVAGLKGSRWNWDFDFDLFYSQNKTKENLNGGFPLYSRLLPLLDSGVVNLFGPNSADITNQVAATNFVGQTFGGESKNYGLSLKGSTEIAKLPAGPLAMALGFDARKETLSQTPNEVLGQGDVSGYGGNLVPISAERKNEAVFAEFNIPIVRTLEGNVAVRTTTTATSAARPTRSCRCVGSRRPSCCSAARGARASSPRP